MYKYKLIETLLLEKLSCMELVNHIFGFIYPIKNNKRFNVKKQLKKELLFNTIETIFLDNEKKIIHCEKCNKLLTMNSSKFRFFNYLDSVEHNKQFHKLDTNYNESIISFIENYH